jgi:hypothetical protein
MSTRVVYEQLHAWWQQWIRHIVDTATTCPAPGDARWDHVLSELGAQRLSDAERAAHVRTSAQRHGPAPIEVERALAALGEVTRAAARKLQFEPDVTEDTELATALDRFEAAAARTVSDHLERIVSALRPAVTTSSIFANAGAITMGFGPPVAADVSTLACSSCGAPRRDVRTQRVCEHCGSAI